MSLGERLKEARKSKGITQEKLANLLGTSRGVITNLEHDKVDTPQPLIIKTICNILEINQEWLTLGSGEMNSVSPVKSSKILSDIYNITKELSEDEQIYILNVIKTYKNHIDDKDKLRL